MLQIYKKYKKQYKILMNKNQNFFINKVLIFQIVTSFKSNQKIYKLSITLKKKKKIKIKIKKRKICLLHNKISLKKKKYALKRKDIVREKKKKKKKKKKKINVIYVNKYFQ